MTRWSAAGNIADHTSRVLLRSYGGAGEWSLMCFFWFKTISAIPSIPDTNDKVIICIYLFLLCELTSANIVTRTGHSKQIWSDIGHMQKTIRFHHPSTSRKSHSKETLQLCFQSFSTSSSNVRSYWNLFFRHCAIIIYHMQNYTSIEIRRVHCDSAKSSFGFPSEEMLYNIIGVINTTITFVVLVLISFEPVGFYVTRLLNTRSPPFLSHYSSFSPSLSSLWFSQIPSRFELRTVVKTWWEPYFSSIQDGSRGQVRFSCVRSADIL